MVTSPAVADIAHTIQLAVAPVFLLAGIGALLNMLAGRLARIVDRTRTLEAAFTPADHPSHGRQVAELRVLDRRILVVNLALLLAVASAIAVCLVVAGLFVAALADLGFARTMAVAFILAMALLVASLIAFLFEVHLALSTIRVPVELLEREQRLLRK